MGGSVKEGKDRDFWCQLLDRITGKRNRQMRFGGEQSRQTGIGTLVFGWNKDQQQQSNMGRKGNQKFVSIPTARLKTRIQQLCEL